MSKIINKSLIFGLGIMLSLSLIAQDYQLGDRIYVGGTGFQHVDASPAGGEFAAIFGTLGQGITNAHKIGDDAHYIGFWYGTNWQYTTVEETQTGAEKIQLSNYPNPFNSTTQIKFNLETSANVKINIYDVNGNLVITLGNGYYNSGTHEVTWNGKNRNNLDAESGSYLYEVTVEPLGASINDNTIRARNIMVLVK